ncbi:MAG: ABC transporter permease [Defluviitaleaceae bacterium]|nr:ABC transporter permease [Defluviitaleaceae bacterium]MCL2238713.1 ABC transporter permease [Defluviitaleaceae bacterium]
MIALYKKELRAYFSQMVGYAFLAFMLFLMGMNFTFINVFTGSGRFANTLVAAAGSFMFFILVPILTMRLFSEEIRHKTDQLLYTSPLSVTQIVLGKFLAAFSLFLLGVGITVLFPVLITRYAVEGLATNQIVGAYIGFILIGLCCIAVGMFISVLTDNQIIAAVSTFAAVYVMFLMDSIAMTMPVSAGASLVFVALVIVAVAGLWYYATRHWLSSAVLGALGVAVAVGLYFYDNLIYDAVILRVLLWFSLYTRFQVLSAGILNLADLVYYLSFAGLFVYLTVNVIEKRRWR